MKRPLGLSDRSFNGSVPMIYNFVEHPFVVGMMKKFLKPSFPTQIGKLGFVAFQEESLYFCLYHWVWLAVGLTKHSFDQ